MAKHRPVRLFVSYSSKDQRYKDDLETNLALMKHQGLISSWDMRQLTAGEPWDDRVKEELELAQVIVLLITTNFLASYYIQQVELEKAFQRHKRKTAVVVSVIMSDSEWRETPLKDVQVLPPGGKAIVNWKPRAKGWVEVAQGVRKVLAKLGGDAATMEVPAAPKSAAKKGASKRSASRKPAIETLRALAREYERVRAAMPSGSDRTRVMERVYSDMLRAAAEFDDEVALKELMNSNSPGERLAAIAVLERTPNRRCVKWLGGRFSEKTETPFVGYHAATALYAACGAFGAKEEKLLRSAIDQGYRDLGPASASTDRARMLLAAETRLRPSAQRGKRQHLL
ncbi:MAG: toll/interleukin-1 receptor domain-containing protein [Thermoanaerobaculia bacterium]